LAILAGPSRPQPGARHGRVDAVQRCGWIDDGAITIATERNRYPMNLMQHRLTMLVFLLAGLVMVAGFAEPLARAAEAAERIVVGINVPLTGPYSQQGEDEKRGYELAIKRINAAGGLLGKRVEYVIKDTASKPDQAKANALEMIKRDGAVMLTGGASSAVALALGDLAQEQRVPFMSGITNSNAVTGHDKTAAGWSVQKAHRYTFRWFNSAYMTANALGPHLVQQLGADKNYFYITADYTWGHSLVESLRYITESKGAFTMDNVLTPLGATDFSAALDKVAKAKPHVLVLVLYGNDQVAALKQIQERRLKESMQVVAPVTDLHLVKQAGADAMAGVLAGTNWYWSLAERYPGSKEFVEAYSKEYNRMPGEGAAVAWVDIYQWAAAVTRAGSVAGPAVVKALEGHEFTLLKGKERWRDWDHQAVSSVLVVKGKKRDQIKGEWDLLEVLAEVDGAKVVPTREENPVVLEALE
jgi:ABC-type branched-subunit amino acid transport system substrate-binding protein